MGLLDNDKYPQDISLKDAYMEIYKWYTSNTLFLNMILKSKGKKLIEIVNKLPSPKKAKEAEMIKVLNMVRTGELEWCYHASNGNYKMGAYAQSGLDKI